MYYLFWRYCWYLVFVQRLHMTEHPHSRTQPHSKSRLILTLCVCVCVCVCARARARARMCVRVDVCICVCVGERDRARERERERAKSVSLFSDMYVITFVCWLKATYRPKQMSAICSNTRPSHSTLKMEALPTSVMFFPLPYNSMSQPKTQDPMDIHRCEKLQISNGSIWINRVITGGLLQTSWSCRIYRLAERLSASTSSWWQKT